jgi:hypothetical protein
LGVLDVICIVFVETKQQNNFVRQSKRGRFLFWGAGRDNSLKNNGVGGAIVVVIGCIVVRRTALAA